MYGHGAAQFGGEHEVTTIIGPLDGAADEGAGQSESNGTDYRSEGATVAMPDTEARTIEVKGAAVDAAAAAASLPVHVEHVVVIKLLPASAPPPPLDPKAVAIARGLPLHVPSPAALTVWLAAAAILGVGAFAACKRMQVARQRLARGARGGGGGRGAVVRVHALPRHKGELDLEGASVCAPSSIADHSAMGFFVTSSDVASIADGIASESASSELASESVEHERKLARQYVRRDDGELSDDEDGELSDDEEAQVGLKTSMRSLLSHHKYSFFLDQAKDQGAAAKAAVVAELEDADTMTEMLFTSRVNELIKTKRLAERLTILKNHGLD